MSSMNRGLRIHCYVTVTVATLLLLVEWSQHVAAVVRPTPEYILPCNRSDTNINLCIKRAFNHLRPYLLRGIPDINLPPIEPLTIPKMAMENGNGAVRVRAVFSNMTTHGASNYSIVNVKSDLNAYRIDLALEIPRIEVSGKYEVTGNILLFPVRSRGEFWAVFYDVVALAKIHGKEVTTNGETFMKIEKLGVDFGLGKSRFKIRDFLNGGNVLGEAMNQFLNQNANEIIQEMKPAATQSISRHFREFLNIAFLQIPVNVWLKDY